MVIACFSTTDKFSSSHVTVDMTDMTDMVNFVSQQLQK